MTRQTTKDLKALREFVYQDMRGSGDEEETRWQQAAINGFERINAILKGTK